MPSGGAVRKAVRFRRGRILHVPYGCARVSRPADVRRAVPVPRDEVAAAWLRQSEAGEGEEKERKGGRLGHGDVSCCDCCFPPCMVCAEAPGWPMPCEEDGHALCDDCFSCHLGMRDGVGDLLRPSALARRRARAGLRSPPTLLPPCPCGQGRPLSPSDLARCHLVEVLGRAAEGAASHAREEALAQRRSRASEEELLLCERCPRCGAVFTDFDACAALRCARCDAVFCGLCDALCDEAADGGGSAMDACHAHVRTCALNPRPGTYYVPLDEWRVVRERERERRVAAHLREVHASEGWACALASMVRLRRLGAWPVRALLARDADEREWWWPAK